MNFFEDLEEHALTCLSYQLNPDRLKEEVVTNALVVAMTNFPSSQFHLALHLINPSAANQGELHEAISTLRTLNSQLEGAQYAQFWSKLNEDDLCADLIADIADFDEEFDEDFEETVYEDLEVHDAFDRVESLPSHQKFPGS